MPIGGSKGRRGRRVASVIRQVVSRELVTGLNDPRLTLVTVTGVDLAPDLRVADVRVSIMGDAKAQEECFRAIRHAHGRLQERVAEALTVKFVPTLRFHVDESVKRSVALGALIARARAEDEANRAERIRRGVEPAAEPPPLEESPPVPIAEPPLAAAPGLPAGRQAGKVKELQEPDGAHEPDDGGTDPPAGPARQGESPAEA
ncbi:MAG: 30S ribosome-binding factor RbfA [Planctomycetes bacterium]|nr:30S ribosome-binding factor RbfA [Planctomycetota bacterium]